MSSQNPQSEEDLWIVRRCSIRMRMEAISALEAEGFVIHDEYPNSASDENEEFVIVARKPS